MMGTTLDSYCREKIKYIDSALEKFVSIPTFNSQFPDDHYDNMHPPVIFEAMRYSLLSGGKRLRPIMLMAAADTVGGSGVKYLPVACSLEMIHAYSLIHDDLPAMDDDDYRRGKPTNHKVYGEGMAILAGDALLTAAFETMLAQEDVRPEILLRVINEISSAAGSRGMVGGQAADLVAEGEQIDPAALKYIHQAKTGALFKAAVRAGALLGGANEKELQYLTKYAECFGLVFQITDDILDVTGNEEKLGKKTGSDERNQKTTYVSVYSIHGARKMAEIAAEEGLSCLDPFGERSQILREMMRYLLIRQT